jgi:hypothetical protein
MCTSKGLGKSKTPNNRRKASYFLFNKSNTTFCSSFHSKGHSFLRMYVNSLAKAEKSLIISCRNWPTPRKISPFWPLLDFATFQWLGFSWGLVWPLLGTWPRISISKVHEPICRWHKGCYPLTFLTHILNV